MGTAAQLASWPRVHDLRILPRLTKRRFDSAGNRTTWRLGRYTNLVGLSHTMWDLPRLRYHRIFRSAGYCTSQVETSAAGRNLIHVAVEEGSNFPHTVPPYCGSSCERGVLLPNEAAGWAQVSKSVEGAYDCSHRPTPRLRRGTPDLSSVVKPCERGSMINKARA